MSFGIPVRNGLGVGLLASTTLSTRNRAPFSPASLFATGEQGAWYDPSDLTTLFQDSTGATPVTAAAQQVGLALDKSQGLVLGPELVTNGGPLFTVTTGWDSGRALSTVSVASGALRNTATGTSASDAQFTFTGLVVGRTYRLSGSFSIGTSPSYRIRVSSVTGLAGGNVIDELRSSDATYSGVFVATATTMYVGILGSFTAGGQYCDIISISVKLLPGNHAFQSTSAQRPTLGREPYTGVRNLLTFTEQFDNAAWGKLSASVTPNAATAPDGTTTADKLIEAAANAGHGLQILGVYTGTSARTNSIYLKAAERKRVALGFSSSSGVIANANVVVDLSTGTVISSPSLPVTVAMQDVGNGWYRVSISGTSGEGDRFVLNTLLDSATAPAAYLGDGTSGILVWGGQAEFGPLTAYQRVVSSFDVTQAGVPDVWYLSFDGTDDGMLTGTITPGTDKAQVFAGVRKLSDAAAGLIAEMSTSIDTNAGTLAVFSSTTDGTGNRESWASEVRGAGNKSGVQGRLYISPNTSVVATQLNISGATEAAKAGLRVNGLTPNLFRNTIPTPTTPDTGNFLAYPLYIGRRGGTTLPLNGRIYSLIVRFGANLSASTILQTETWVGDKTGINIPLSVSPTIFDRFNDTVLDRDGQTIEVR
jgi:hypothetical protein